MRFKVTRQFQRGEEQACRTFKTQEEANRYIQQEASANASMKIQVIYRLYDFDELMSELDSSTVTTLSSSDSSETGASGQKSGASFRPTPLPTSPRPSGMPSNWRIDKDKDKDKPEDDKGGRK